MNCPRLLLVESQRIIYKPLTSLLRSTAGVEVINAFSLHEAWRRYCDQNFDVITFEAVMPIQPNSQLDMTGQTTVALIKMMRHSFLGLMVALSSRHNDLLLEAGCDTSFEWKCGIVPFMKNDFMKVPSTRCHKDIL